MPNALNGRHHAAIEGLPEAPIYCWVKGKAPAYEKWNAPNNLLTPQALFEKTPPDGFQPDGFGMVSGRWSGTMAVDFDVQPERPEQAEETFRNITGYSSDALPPSATVISGRPGRRRVILRVPAEWNVPLSGFSGKLLDLELRWEAEDPDTRAPKPIQSVICGNHPKSPDWHFRWQEGLSPAEVGIAEAPAWLLAAMVRRKGIAEGLAAADEEGGGGGGRAPGEPGPCDLLDPKQQRKLLRHLSTGWPYRGGAAGTRWQASWQEDGFVGLLGALHNLLGAETALAWLGDTEWFDKNEDWGPHGSFKQAVNSVGKSKTDRPAGWGILVSLAGRTHSRSGLEFKEAPVKLPGWALPPQDVETSSLAKDAAKEVNTLLNGIAEIDGIEDPAQRLSALQMLTRNMGKNGAEMARLLQAVEEGLDATREVTLADLLQTDLSISPAIQGLLSRGCLTLLASQGGIAKTSLCYQMAACIASGQPFAGTLETVQGPVLIVQKDETNRNAKTKAVAMDLAKLPPEVQEQMKFRFSWHPGMFPELKQWIEESGAVAVFMDSLGTLMGGSSGSLNDAEVALHLYRLNRLAADMNVALVLTHHTRKPTQEKKVKEGERKRVSASDLYGSSYIHNAASDVWGLVIDGEEDDRPIYALEVIKPRSGITQRGDRFELLGNLDDLSFAFRSFNFSEKTEELTGSSAEKVLQVLRGRDLETAIKVEELPGVSGVSIATVKRVLRQLYADQANTGVERVKVLGGRGTKPSFAYFCV